MSDKLHKEFFDFHSEATSFRNSLKTFNENNLEEIHSLIQRYVKATDDYLNDGRGLSSIKEVKEQSFKIIAYGWETDSCHLFPNKLLTDPNFILDLEKKKEQQDQLNRQENIKRDLETLDQLEKKYRKYSTLKL